MRADGELKKCQHTDVAQVTVHATPTFMAAQEGQSEALQLLIAARADVDKAMMECKMVTSPDGLQLQSAPASPDG